LTQHSLETAWLQTLNLARDIWFLARSKPSACLEEIAFKFNLYRYVVAYDTVTTREGTILISKNISLSDNVMACPPSECENLGVLDDLCAPHKFSVKGIQGCIGMEAEYTKDEAKMASYAVNTLLKIQFMVGG
jgi:hypothetical protein